MLRNLEFGAVLWLEQDVVESAGRRHGIPATRFVVARS
jgi:hypothetical protein